MTGHGATQASAMMLERFHDITADRRRLGQTDLVVSGVGVGTSIWGAKQYGYGTSHTYDDVRQAYRSCLDAGLDFFDTTPKYGEGESERMLGTFRRQDGRTINIATKFAPSGPWKPARWRTSPRVRMLSAVNESLQRLGVERIDLYQLDGAPPANFIEYVDAMAEAVIAGKIRAAGVCNFSASLLRKTYARLRQHGIPLASAMVSYSLLGRKPETVGILDACRELDVALIARAPLAERVLTGTYRNTNAPMPLRCRMSLQRARINESRDAERWAARIGRLVPSLCSLGRAQLEPLFVVLEETARAHKKTLAQVALNWLLTKDLHVLPIASVKTMRQASENAGALGWRLTSDEMDRIEQAEVATR